jgi:hypothetical protein
MEISSADRKVLRALAEEYAQIAAQERNERLRQMWIRHNALEQDRPMVVTYVETPMLREILPPQTDRCTGEFARQVEYDLRELLHWSQLGDDRPFDPVYPCRMVIHNTGWGVIEAHDDSGVAGGSKHFNAVIEDEGDIEKISMPRVTVDHQASLARLEALRDAFDGVLDVELRGYHVPWFSPMDDFITWRGIENMFLDLADRPEWVHAVMERLTQGYLGMLEQIEQQGGLARNDRMHFVGSGGCGYTDALPAEGFDPGHVRPRDMWGQATAQIFSEVSPAMHEEFCFPYDRRWLDRFGLNCYGCCEPLHRKVDLMRKLPRLRRISMSPRVDHALGAEAVGRDFIYSAKPNPAVFATDGWDLEKVRAEIRDMLDKTRGCNVELIMKDTQTCRNDPRRPKDWTRIAMEEVERLA